MIPAAIRPEAPVSPGRSYGTAFWVGISMSLLGLAVVIYAAVQIYTYGG